MRLTKYEIIGVLVAVLAFGFTFAALVYVAAATP